MKNVYLKRIISNFLLKKRLIIGFLVVTNILIIFSVNLNNYDVLEFILVPYFIMQLLLIILNRYAIINNFKIVKIITYSSAYNRKIDRKLFSDFGNIDTYDLTSYLSLLGNKFNNIICHFRDRTEADMKLSGYFNRFYLKLSQFIFYSIICLIVTLFVSVIFFELVENNYLIIFAYLIARYIAIFFFSIIFDYISFYRFYKQNNILYLYIYSHIYRQNDKIIIPQILPEFNSTINYLYDNIISNTTV